MTATLNATSTDYLLAATLVIALGLALGLRPHGGVPGTALAMALVIVFASALSWVFTWLGLLLRSPNAIMSLAMIVLFPLTAHPGQQHVRRPGHHVRLAARDRRRQPGSHLVTAARAATAATASAAQRCPADSPSPRPCSRRVKS